MTWIKATLIAHSSPPLFADKIHILRNTKTFTFKVKLKELSPSKHFRSIICPSHYHNVLRGGCLSFSLSLLSGTTWKKDHRIFWIQFIASIWAANKLGPCCSVPSTRIYRSLHIFGRHRRLSRWKLPYQKFHSITGYYWFRNGLMCTRSVHHKSQTHCELLYVVILCPNYREGHPQQPVCLHILASIKSPP